MKRKLSASPAEILLHLGLLTAFVLLMSAHEFAAENPTLTSILIFIFSLPYLAVATVSRRGNFLYGTMLFGAVAYFLASYALGAPTAVFPLLAVPLVVALLAAGHYLLKRLSPELASFPTTVFRAMNLTIAIFALWALTDVSELMGGDSPLRYVAAAAFLGYAALYLAHCLAGSSASYVYAMTLFLTLGGILATVAMGYPSLCWLAAIAAAAVVMLVGTTCHRKRQYRWSRHFYFASTGVIFLSLPLSMWRWQYVLIDLALGSLLLQAAYGWIASAVPSIRQAMMAERVMAKFFFICSILLSAAIAPLVFFLSWDPYVAYAALISGLTFAWIAKQRPDVTVGGWNIYVLGAAFFGAAGLLGVGRQLPPHLAQAWSLASAPVVLGALGLLVFMARKREGQTLTDALTVGAIFPACLAWLIPLMQGEAGIAAIGALLAAGVLAGMALGLKKRMFFTAIGPAAAGALIAGATLWASSEQALSAWIVCAAGALAWYIYADSKNLHAIRGATNLAWLILSTATLVLAAQTGLSHLLYSIVAVGVLSILVAGRSRTQAARDLLERFVAGMGVALTLAAVVVGPLTELGATTTGLCLLMLSIAHWAAWSMRRGVGVGRLANGLFALGALLMIYGLFTGVEVRLLAGTAVVGVLFAIGLLARKRQTPVARTAIITAHLTATVLACVALIQAWPLSSTFIALAALPLVLLYALVPLLRQDLGFRIGTMLWVSFAAIFALTALAQAPYIRQLHLIVLLSLAWLAAGYVLTRMQKKAWSFPMYISAAVVACFCGLVKMSAPASVGTWHVFLTSGMVFACLFLILRQDIFAYLLTLSLSLLAYDWVRSSTSMFTQDVLFYLVIGGVVIAVLFILPYVRRRIGQMGTVPIFNIFTRRGIAMLGIVVVAFVVLLLSTYTLKLTGHPRFCTSCHNMEEYYASWQHSAHANVSCIECHYEPGVTNTIKGKIEGLVQVVKYVSHSYSSKPQAMISNKSCMRSAECHEGMDTQAEPKNRTAMASIKFRHDTHLAGKPRGKALNCVSCHGQTVKGQHISVGKTTCLTCHFYGGQNAQMAAAAPAHGGVTPVSTAMLSTPTIAKTGQCLTCHRMPEKTMTFMGQDFKHQKFLAGKDNVHCTLCHSQVTQGDAATSATRCRNCHLGDIEPLKDQAEFHLVHVSKGHFDCLQCHDQIKHGSRPREQQLLASGDCKTCHSGERHSVQERMYAGTAVAAMKAMPDPMYKAGVACGGCHTESRTVGIGAMPFTKKFSGPAQCADCHTAKTKPGDRDATKTKYGKRLADWQEDTKDRIDEFKPELAKLAKAIEAAKAPTEADLTKAKGLLSSAQMKLSFVVADGSLGAHNYPYICEILDDVEDTIDSCRRTVSGWAQVRSEEAGQ